MTIYFRGEGKDDVFALFSHALLGSLLYTFAVVFVGEVNDVLLFMNASSAATLPPAARCLAEVVGDGMTETISRISISCDCGCLIEACCGCC